MKNRIQGIIIGVIITLVLVSAAYAAYGTISGQFNNDVTVNGVSIDGNVAIIDGAEYIKKADIISYLNALSGTGQTTQSQTTSEPATDPTPQPTPNATGYNAELNALTEKYNTDIKALEDKAVSDKNKLSNDWYLRYGIYKDTVMGKITYNTMLAKCTEVDVQLAKDKESRTNQYNSDVAALKTKYGI